MQRKCEREQLFFNLESISNTRGHTFTGYHTQKKQKQTRPVQHTVSFCQSLYKLSSHLRSLPVLTDRGPDLFLSINFIGGEFWTEFSNMWPINVFLQDQNSRPQLGLCVMNKIQADISGFLCFSATWYHLVINLILFVLQENNDALFKFVLLWNCVQCLLNKC